MRDTHEKLPELIRVFERDGGFFAIIGVTISDSTGQFEIGLSPDAYHAAKHILQKRPFDKLPGVAYRYFFVPTIRRLPDRERVEADFRIEQGRDASQFRFEIPEALASNLMWLFELKDFVSASHLRRIDANN